MNVKRSEPTPGFADATSEFRGQVAPTLEAIVLAAGAGTRFGGAKLLAPWRDGVLLDAALASAFAAPVRRVTVAIGAEGERVTNAARAFAARRGELSRLTISPTSDWRQGMSASLRRAVVGLASDVSAVFVFLGDMPCISTEVPPALARALTPGVDAVVPVFGGVAGHPALIGAPLFATIAGLQGDRGARNVLQALGPRLARVAAPDDGVLFDIDTQAALVEAGAPSPQPAAES